MPTVPRTTWRSSAASTSTTAAATTPTIVATGRAWAPIRSTGPTPPTTTCNWSCGVRWWARRRRRSASGGRTPRRCRGCPGTCFPDRIRGLPDARSPLPPAPTRRRRPPVPARSSSCGPTRAVDPATRTPRAGNAASRWPTPRRSAGREQLIYLEDQYLWSFDVARIFAAALHRSSRLHLIAVVPRRPDNENQLYNESAMLGHAEALAMVREAGEDRVQVLDVENLQGLPVYVHSKLCIVDDVWAAVGSDNFNMRSWTHDSELTAAVLDGERDRRAPTDPGGLGDGARRFARELRLTLMREHLDVDEDDDLLDPARAADIVRKSVAELDAWHDGGGHGPRPAGRVRSHPIGKGRRAARPASLVHRPDLPVLARSGRSPSGHADCAARTDLVSLPRMFGQVESRRLSRLQLPRASRRGRAGRPVGRTPIRDRGTDPGRIRSRPTGHIVPKCTGTAW